MHGLYFQGMFLTDLREQLDNYGVPQAFAYLNNKLAEKPAVRQLASNTMFGQVGAGRRGFGSQQSSAVHVLGRRGLLGSEEEGCCLSAILCA